MAESQTTDRRSPIDIMDDVLRPHLGSLEATSAAVRCWHALRRGGWLQDEPLEPLEDQSDEE
jgi:hypothetical protein